jgi:hypothetical protein
MNSVVAEKKFIQERLGIPYENLSQSYLRAESLLGSTKSTYQFFLQRGQVATPLVTENLLELNDQFIITHFRLAIRGNTSSSPTDTDILNSIVHTYPAPSFFGRASTSKLNCIYNANLSFTIDRKQFLPAFPTNAFLRVPTSQGANSNIVNVGGLAAALSYVANVGATSPAGLANGTQNYVHEGYDNGLFGFYVSEPTLIDGRQTLDLSLNLGATVAFTSDPNTYNIYAVFETRGYLVVNAKS